MTPFLRLRLCAPVFLACLCATTPLYAADLGGDCCADLEERIAELEATTARKGNRKVSLSVSGHVNHAVLFWDDGHERNAYVVGNKNDQSNFSFTGDAEIATDAFPRLAGEEGVQGRCAAFIEELASLSKRLGLQPRLRDVGIGEEHLKKMAADAMKQQRLLVNNPRNVSEPDALAIYRAAW